MGEHGTGKLSLIKLIVAGMNEPKGVSYVDISGENTSGHLAEAVANALDFKPDHDKCNRSTLFLALLEANRPAVPSLRRSMAALTLHMREWHI